MYCISILKRLRAIVLDCILHHGLQNKVFIVFWWILFYNITSSVKCSFCCDGLYFTPSHILESVHFFVVVCSVYTIACSIKYLLYFTPQLEVKSNITPVLAENSIWNTAVPLLNYSCMFQVEVCSQLEICKSVCMFIVLAIIVETD